MTRRPSTSVNRPRGPDDEIADRLEALSVDAAHRGDHGAASTLAWRAGALRTDRDRARPRLAPLGKRGRHRRHHVRGEARGRAGGDRRPVAHRRDPSHAARLATLDGDPHFAAELLASHGETIIAASPFLGAVLTALAGSCAWMRADGSATRVLADQAVALVGGQVTAEMAPIANFLIRAGAATGYDDPALAVSTARMIRESGQTEFAGSALFCLMVADQIAEADAFYRWAIVAARDAGSITDVAWLHGPATLLLCRQGHLDAAYAAGSEAIDLAPFVLGPFPSGAGAQRARVRLRGTRRPCPMRRARRRDRPTRHHGRHPDRLAGRSPRRCPGAARRPPDRRRAQGARAARCGSRTSRHLRRHHLSDHARADRDPGADGTDRRGTRDAGHVASSASGSTCRRSRRRLWPGSMRSAPSPSTSPTATSRPPKSCSRQVPYPFELARTHLYRGERLRRARRRRDAAKELYEARAGFKSSAPGPGAPRPTPSFGPSASDPRRPLPPRDLPGETLSPQEYQVAMAASGGAATRDIAASLFISPKTVEAHLTRIYRKLGVSSKAQLVAALGSTGGPASDRPPA